ncbi:MAG TPA: hypothetical protein VK611_21500 [Acidimicrobiales bacterium]|nr:hypothetical protein [Acidimicrobiales bacterium]
MPRVNVYLPDTVLETLDALRRERPTFNLSKLLQQAIEEAENCRHDQLACARCGCQVDHQYLLSHGITHFYNDAHLAVGELVLRGGGTAEGAQRVLQDVAKLWHGHGLVHWDAAHAPLNRPSRSVREAIWERRHQGRPIMPTTHGQLADDSRRAAQAKAAQAKARDEEIA